MTTYNIISTSLTAKVTIDDDGVVTSSDDVLDWAIGRDWTWLRAYCYRKGWTIQPLLDHPSRVVGIDLDNDFYELLWNNNRCVRITRHAPGVDPEDLTVDELPDEIKEMIE